MSSKIFPKSVEWNNIVYDNAPDGSAQVTGALIRYPYTDSVVYGDNYVDFKDRIRKGQDCTTSATGHRVIRIKNRVGQQSATCKSPPAPYGYSCVWVNDGGPMDVRTLFTGIPYNSGLYASALSRFVREAREAQYRFQGGTFFGELRQTISLLKRPVQGVRELTLKYHGRVKRNFSRYKKRRDLRKFLADEWLTYSFGVVPLISDIDDVMHDLALLTVGRPPLQPIRAVAWGTDIPTDTTSAFTPVLYWKGSLHEVIKVTEIVIMRGSIIVNVPKVGEAYNGAGALKDAFSDFLPTVWNLIPYSFLVDYFTNIGDIVSGLSFNKSTVAWSNYTKRQQIEWSRTFDITTDLGRYGIAWKPDSHKERTPIKAECAVVNWERGILGSYVPDFEFNVLGYRDWKKFLNITALLSSCRSVK